MKEFLIGQTKYNLCEDISDLWEYRLPYFKEFILRAFENNDLPVYSTFFSEFQKLYNAQDFYNCAIKVDQLHESIKRKEPLLENLHYAFALICLEPDENQLNVDMEYLKEKILRMFNNGLKGGICKEVVLSFMAASPFEFRNYGAIMMYMKQT